MSISQSCYFLGFNENKVTYVFWVWVLCVFLEYEEAVFGRTAVIHGVGYGGNGEQVCSGFAEFGVFPVDPPEEGGEFEHKVCQFPALSPERQDFCCEVSVLH